MPLFGELFLFLLQNSLFGNIPFLRDTIILGALRLKDPIFLLTSILFILKFIKIQKPHNTHTSHHANGIQGSI